MSKKKIKPRNPEMHGALSFIPLFLAMPLL
jgi:hypothetical protein